MKNKESLGALRHSAAHLLAAAVLELYPDAKPTIGPAIESGFYYDFEFPPGADQRGTNADSRGKFSLSEADLPKIEKKMADILPSWQEFVRTEITPEDARLIFKNNPYKLELIDEIVQKGEKLTLYSSAPLPKNLTTYNLQLTTFFDLCRGGHIKNPAKELKAFKLLSLAGAYWRGNEKNKMLTRIYGTAFGSQKELDAYLVMLEEAKKRDHKKLGVELDLFTFSPLVGSGLPLWTPKGTLLRDILDSYVSELRKARGYERVDIPHLTKKDLYEKSGHWDKFKDELFQAKTREGHEFALKPMNCPHHTQIYARKQWSYRELPQRYASTTKVYRDEQSGELAGLSRVRAITQDDAHVFCRESQIVEEVNSIWSIVESFYGAFGFVLKIRLSLSDPEHPEKYLGTKERWDKAEKLLRRLIDAREGAKKLEKSEAIGEAAFYGPKVDFLAKDSLGREWQVATIQLDMNMPERFDLACIDESGKPEKIVMIHAAIMGSIERFLAVIIEHFSGAFPLWLSPVQVRILPVSDKFKKYADSVNQSLVANDIRVELPDASETLGKRIRESEKSKVPYTLIVGDKEEKAGTVNVRKRGTENQEEIELSTFVERLKKEIENKSI